MKPAKKPAAPLKQRMDDELESRVQAMEDWRSLQLERLDALTKTMAALTVEVKRLADLQTPDPSIALPAPPAGTDSSIK